MDKTIPTAPQVSIPLQVRAAMVSASLQVNGLYVVRIRLRNDFPRYPEQS